MISHQIRTAARDDAPQLAHLLTLLGHDTSPERIIAMWDAWEASGNSALVAERPDADIIGLATLHQMLVLHRPRPVGRITALIVTEAARGEGAGRTLVDAAEARLREYGCGLLEITSNLRLTDAHSFYEHLGYARTSIRLARDLAAV